MSDFSCAHKNMESEISAQTFMKTQSTLSYIYGNKAENIYDTIKKKQPYPDEYDEVFQSNSSQKKPKPRQENDPNCDAESLLTYCKFRDKQFLGLMRKWYKNIPIWVKITIPIIIILATFALNGLLTTELIPFGVLSKYTTQNSNRSLTTLSVITTQKASSRSTLSSDTTTVTEKVITKPTKNYSSKPWYIRDVASQTFYCDTWQEISSVKLQPLDLQGTTCSSIADCLTMIDLYKFNSAKRANYTFYIDEYGNIYEGRDWYCPYKSGELWIALLTTSYNELDPKSELMLRHYYEMVSYKRAYEYFGDEVEEEFVNRCSLKSHTSSQCVYY